MTELAVITYDWVPEPPRGYVRDLRVRWAPEEAGLPYRVATTPFRERAPDILLHQPFNQVPWLTDGDLSIFESGAILHPSCRDYVARATARPAFVKAHADQLAHFAAADR